MEYDPDAFERPSIPLQRLDPQELACRGHTRLVRARLAQTAPVSPFALTRARAGSDCKLQID